MTSRRSLETAAKAVAKMRDNGQLPDVLHSVKDAQPLIEDTISAALSCRSFGQFLEVHPYRDVFQSLRGENERWDARANSDQIDSRMFSVVAFSNAQPAPTWSENALVDRYPDDNTPNTPEGRLGTNRAKYSLTLARLNYR